MSLSKQNDPKSESTETDWERSVDMLSLQMEIAELKA